MLVHVRLSGTLARRLGPCQAVDLAHGATGDDLLERLAIPAFGWILQRAGRVIGPTDVLADGDELAVLRPTGGVAGASTVAVAGASWPDAAADSITLR